MTTIESQAPKTPSNDASKKPGKAAQYGADQIKILEGLEAVRKRPGMYIGDTGLAGLHHLCWEAVDNSIDEAMAGRATTVLVRVHADGALSVTDDGVGIPIDPKKHENPAYNNKPAVELVMTVLHAGGKFGEEGSAYKVSGGLHGVGISCVNALSEWLEVRVHRDGGVYNIGFERGKTSEPLTRIGDVPADAPNKTGTEVTFKPDPLIFPDTTWNYTTLSQRMRELAYLNPGVTLKLVDERVGPDGKIKEETHKYDRGLLEYVEHMNHNKNSLHEVVTFSGEQGTLAVEAAFQFSDSYSELILSFANNIRTVDGGTHLSGFKTALTRALNGYIKQANLIKEKDPMPTGDDWREGLAAVISVKLPEPQFEGQTKGKLRNTDVEGFVTSIVNDRLKAWLEEHPGEAKKICQKGIVAAQAREAARKARDLTRRKSALESGSMPHKLRDCTTRDVERSEMFIVEGDSAGGSATQGRDVETQAILPLRGKLINVEKARLDKVLAFEEIRTLISALRCGIGEDFDISKLRYGRVIIMTDADVDGSHIRTLLLTFFFRQMPDLIRRGRIYCAQPPLYQVARGKTSRYVLNEREMDDVLVELGLDGASLLVREVPTDAKTGRSLEAKTVRTIEGDELGEVVRNLRRLDELVTVTERRGYRFLEMLSARDTDPEGKHRLPTHRLTWHDGEAFAWSHEQASSILKKHGLRNAEFEPSANGKGMAPDVAHVRELHETREIAAIIERLGALGLSIEDYGLVREEAVTGERIPTKYAWSTPIKSRKQAHRSDDDADGEHDSASHGADEGKLVEAASIREILSTLREVGRRGLEIKRFKGLGEMDPAQLWETTMDPSRRTLLRVTWDQGEAADELFTTLMGENVESRRAYIEEHALEVRSLDV
ncbi:MAG: DNA gyrase subunit B [Phycisphaerales bacterium]|nr:DNA gyrase subunit B [Phycisphaerales bacterium]